MSGNTAPYSQKSPRNAGAAQGGLILIVLGATFLLQGLGLLGRNFNGWALFILVPALSSFWASGVVFPAGIGPR